MQSTEELLKQEQEAYETQQRLNRLYTPSGKQVLITMLVALAWTFVLLNYGDVNFAQPLVELEQGK